MSTVMEQVVWIRTVEFKVEISDWENIKTGIYESFLTSYIQVGLFLNLKEIELTAISCKPFLMKNLYVVQLWQFFVQFPEAPWYYCFQKFGTHFRMNEKHCWKLGLVLRTHGANMDEERKKGRAAVTNELPASNVYCHYSCIHWKIVHINFVIHQKRWRITAPPQRAILFIRKSVRDFFKYKEIFTDFRWIFHESKGILAKGVRDSGLICPSPPPVNHTTTGNDTPLMWPKLLSKLHAFSACCLSYTGCRKAWECCFPSFFSHLSSHTNWIEYHHY